MILDIKQSIKQLAYALTDLNFVFVGGAIIECYVNDPAKEAARPTIDLDLVFDIVTVLELETLRQTLSAKGFTQTADDKVICRFRFNNLIVDVMSTNEIGWAPANKWFKKGYKNKIPFTIDESEIFIMPLPYFLASKFSAFNDRGADARTSKDFEDIVYLLNYQTNIVGIIKGITDIDLGIFLTEQLSHITTEDNLKEGLLAALPYDMQAARYKIIIERINNIIT